MNAQEIINELASGKTVAILSDDAFEFMREVERYKISCEGISMAFGNGQCVMKMETRHTYDQRCYYCRNQLRHEAKAHMEIDNNG